MFLVCALSTAGRADYWPHRRAALDLRGLCWTKVILSHTGQCASLVGDVLHVELPRVELILLPPSDRPKEFWPKAERDFRAAPISAESRK